MNPNILDTEALAYLKQIADGIRKLTDESHERGSFMGWTYYEKGKRRVYEQTVTYTGSAQTVNLDIECMFQLDLVIQIWNDATARDFSTRVYTDPSTTRYVDLDSDLANVALNRIAKGGDEYIYPPATRVQMYYANTTAGKTCKVTIVVTEV